MFERNSPNRLTNSKLATLSHYTLLFSGTHVLKHTFTKNRSQKRFINTCDVHIVAILKNRNLGYLFVIANISKPEKKLE